MTSAAHRPPCTWSSRVAAVCCAVLILLWPGAARADTLDTILDLVLNSIDPSLVEAKALLKCAIAHDGLTTATLKVCGGNVAKDKADSYLQPGSTAQTVVTVGLAASKKQWGKVIEIGGTKLVLDLACSAAMPPGPPKSVLCSSLSGEISKLARPVVSGLVQALSSSPPDWLRIVTMLGPGLACKIEQIPALVRETACGVIGELLAAGKDLAEGLGALAEVAVKGVGIVLDAGDKMLGSYHEKQGPKAHFKAYWVHYTHKAAWLKFVKGDAAMSAFVEGLHKHCRDYYGSSKPCDPMRKVFLDAVNPTVAHLKNAGAVYFDVNLRPALLYHYLFFKNSAGKYPGFNWGGNACHLIEKYPLLEGDLQDSQPRPTVWDHACKPAHDLLLAALAQHKPQLEAQLAALGAQGCTLTSSTSLYCVSYPALAACTKALPAHAGACVVDVGKANAAFAPQIAQQLGKRCHVVSTSHATVQCTRPWKVDQCKSLTASYVAQKSAAWGGKLSLQCTPANDAAFEQGKIKAIEIAGQLNHKAGSAATMATAADDSGAGCKPIWDPLAIGCKNHKVVAKQLEALPGLAVGACAADPNKDGADVPCIVPILAAGSMVESLGNQLPVAGALAEGGGAVTQPPLRSVLPSRPLPAAQAQPALRPELRSALPVERDALPGARTALPSTRPALQSPPPALGTPRTGGGAPDWGAVGGREAPATADVTRLMSTLSCMTERGELRFRCATRAGFERCEALRAQRKVEQCALNERR